METQRVRKLKEGQPGTGPVIYWMSRDQRAADNWALLFSQSLAEEMDKPLAVLFCLVDKFLGADKEHYLFMLEGLKQTEKNLADKNIPLLLYEGDPCRIISNFLKKNSIGVLVKDFNPLKINRKWTEKIKEDASIPFYEVDAHNIVPCWLASGKQEYGAYTIRPKINKLKSRFLTGFKQVGKQKIANGYKLFNIDWPHIYKKRGLPGSPSQNYANKPGEKEAFRVMEFFLENKLQNYSVRKNDPSLEATSGLSPYIHFGQISAQRIALEAVQFKPDAGQQAFLEELIIRKELSDNFCYYNKNYDNFEGFPRWARETLTEHMSDPRPYLYSLNQLKNAKTHDSAWNAAQKEMLITGKMHGYMRMYWAKKILEWTHSPHEALEFAIYLNDLCQMDGRDPNGYAGIAWSIGGVHDRAWPQRKVFGKIRYMSRAGLEKKFNMRQYISEIERLK